MSTFPTTPEFRKHSENVAAVQRGLTQIERAHKAAIRDGDQAAILVLRRFHMLTVGILAESMLRKITVDPTGFDDDERNVIWRSRTQIDRWTAAVDQAFRRHYGVAADQDLRQGIADQSIVARRDQLVTLIRGDLAPVIEDRNKTAHGQWAWQLRSQKENSFKVNAAPEPPNYSAIASQARTIEMISELVYVLAVSEPTFDRDFDRIVTNIDALRPALDGSGYESFEAQLRASRRRFTNAVSDAPALNSLRPEKARSPSRRWGGFVSWLVRFGRDRFQ